jgi:hypothetical protein
MHKVKTFKFYQKLFASPVVLMFIILYKPKLLWKKLCKLSKSPFIMMMIAGVLSSLYIDI